ncbi:hypothetical protein [[Phormidium] sp. ETS-05]|nr:hypothetical protein [[Phormidium] sp. ETS-05]
MGIQNYGKISRTPASVVVTLMGVMVIPAVSSSVMVKLALVVVPS